VTNLAGSTNSSTATLSVYPTAAATLQSAGYTNGQFSFNLTGVPGFKYVIQMSTNLINWVSLRTNPAPLTFMHTNTGNFNQRFYRALYLP
jgi:hypothetical protein